MMIADIQRLVCDQYELSMLDMVSERRWRRVARPRQIAMYLACELTPYSLPRIGRAFGDRHHTTVMHAHRLIKHLNATDYEMTKTINYLMCLLG